MTHWTDNLPADACEKAVAWARVGSVRVHVVEEKKTHCHHHKNRPY